MQITFRWWADRGPTLYTGCGLFPSNVADIRPFALTNPLPSVMCYIRDPSQHTQLEKVECYTMFDEELSEVSFSCEVCKALTGQRGQLSQSIEELDVA